MRRRSIRYVGAVLCERGSGRVGDNYSVGGNVSVLVIAVATPRVYCTPGAADFPLV